MTVLAVFHRVTGITAAWVGSGLDGMEKPEVPAVDLLLHRIASFVAIGTKHLVCMALLAFGGVLLAIDLVFRNPVHLMTVRLRHIKGVGLFILGSCGCYNPENHPDDRQRDQPHHSFFKYRVHSGIGV